jgi:hypothetical protein
MDKLAKYMPQDDALVMDCYRGSLIMDTFGNKLEFPER